MCSSRPLYPHSCFQWAHRFISRSLPIPTPHFPSLHTAATSSAPTAMRTSLVQAARARGQAHAPPPAPRSLSPLGPTAHPSTHKHRCGVQGAVAVVEGQCSGGVCTRGQAGLAAACGMACGWRPGLDIGLCCADRAPTCATPRGMQRLLLNACPCPTPHPPLHTRAHFTQPCRPPPHPAGAAARAGAPACGCLVFLLVPGRGRSAGGCSTGSGAGRRGAAAHRRALHAALVLSAAPTVPATAHTQCLARLF